MKRSDEMLYNDRGMKKWQGLILAEHKEQMIEFEKCNGEPVKKEQINQLLQDSFRNGKKIDIQLNYLSNGLYKDNLIGVVGGFEEGSIYISTDKGLEAIDPESIRHVSKPEHKKWYE